jgi:hypothetical protein
MRNAQRVCRWACAAALAAAAWGCGGGARAGTDSGNDLALKYASAPARERAAVAKAATGELFFFRYLFIKELEKGATTNGAPFIRMCTVEPSSDMIIRFTVDKSVSLKKAAPLAVGSAVAVTGRVKEFGSHTNTILLDPVIVRFQDRASPKAGRELLYEVDSGARRGTDTSSGEERIIR